MKADKEKMKLAKALHLNIRGIRLLHRDNPRQDTSLFLFNVVSSLFPLVMVFFSSKILGELAGERRPDVLRNWAIIAVASVACAQLVIAFLRRWNESERHLNYRRESRIYVDNLARLDYKDAVDGDVIAMQKDIDQTRNFISAGISSLSLVVYNFLGAFAQILGSTALFASIFVHSVPETMPDFQWMNSIWVNAAVLLTFFVVAYVSPVLDVKSKEYWYDLNEAGKASNRLFGFYGFKGSMPERALDVRIYRQDKLFRERMQEDRLFLPGGLIDRYLKGPMGLLQASSVALLRLLMVGVYVFVCVKAWTGAYGVDKVALYIGAAFQLSTGLHTFFQSFGELRTNAKFVEKTFAFLDIPNAFYGGTLTTEKRSDRQYEIEFRDVSFRYPGTEKWALRHVSFRFHVGERMAIVGQNGSGKTTLIKLLCRFYDPDEGTILLNGIDIRKYKYGDYMQIFSAVFQDFNIYKFKLGENVGAGETYDPVLAEEVLRKAGFGDRLDELPEGLETYVTKDLDEDGVNFSGGERQKIAIARALYPNRPFLVLDEPTAALDPITEYEIYTRLNDIVGDRTAIFISHRLSSCKFSDRILVFDEGCLVQVGKHADLVADTSGKYHELWHAQAQYYTDEEKVLLV